MAIKQSISILLRDFARASCPRDALPFFIKCENEAIDVRRKVIQMQNENSHECSSLGDTLSFNNPRNNFANLMEIFASAYDKERDRHEIYCTDDGTEDGIPTTYPQHYVHSYYLGQTGRNFSDAFKELPALTRYMLNKSLQYQVRAIVGSIRATAHAQMIAYFKQQDEMYGPR